MVLIFVAAQADTAKKDKVKSAVYRFTTFNQRVAVAYNIGDDLPSEERVRNTLLSLENSTEKTFLATPCGAFVGNADDDNSGLQGLYANIAACVKNRENVTILSRGVPNPSYRERFLLGLINTIKPSAEYAMQLVDDEVAKEKQMQRLLQLDNDGRSGIKEAPKSSHDASFSCMNEKKETLPLSAKLRRQLTRLYGERAYTGEAAAYGHHIEKAAASKERYTLVSAAHSVDLVPPCTKGSLLTPFAFTVDPPIHSHRNALSPRASVCAKAVRQKSYFFEQGRRSTVMLLKELKEVPQDGLGEPLKGNGWEKFIMTLEFDGENSLLALPGVPRFEDLVKSCSVDFFIRTDCKATEGKRVLVHITDGPNENTGQLFQLSLNWYEEMGEMIRFVVRDSGNRVLEALIFLKDFPEVTSGNGFHHFMLDIHSLDEGVLGCLIDGRHANVQLAQQEHPIAFNSWPHRLFVGGYLDANNSAALVFRGTLIGLRFWSRGDRLQPVVYWPLLVSSSKLVELTKTIPADHHEMLLSLKHGEEPAPHLCPFFDGSLVLNMGSMSLWGELMHNWRLEIRFRTDVFTSMMTLTGVTDRKFKMQEFGIVLNAEPVSTKERFRFHEFNVTFYLVDAFGACCSALLIGSERSSLMDGEWHTLTWKCVGSEYNNFVVRVDGVTQELLYVVREGPNRFVRFDDWICVGGHNVRNWKVKRLFIGQISCFLVSLSGVPYTTLEMDEGPSAYILQDRSGHQNHGLLIHPETGVVRRNDVIWIPVGMDEVDEENQRKPELNLVSFKNNHVSIARVVFTCAFDASGFPHEVLEDMISGKIYEPQLIGKEHGCHYGNTWHSWRAIPEECYKSLGTITQLEESINAFLAAPLLLGHIMLVIRIGDCHVTLLQLHDPELPSGAVYDCNMLKWRYPYTVEGTHGRCELMLHRMIESVEGILLADSMAPYITTRLGPVNAAPGSSLQSEDIIRLLQSCGKPWYLASILHSHLLSSKYGSSLHIIHCVHSFMTFDEAASIFLFNKGLYEGAKEKAATVIQRNWRICLAKAATARLRRIHEAQERKLEEVHAVRTNPIVYSKRNLYALLVTFHHIACSGVSPIKTDIGDLEEALQKQGYVVEVLENPSPAYALHVISQVDVSYSSLIYISGYGGNIYVQQPMLTRLQILHIVLEEGTSRVVIEHTEAETFRTLMTQFRTEKSNIRSRRKKKEAFRTLVPRQLKAGEQEALVRQQTVVFQAARDDCMSEEYFIREEYIKECDEEFEVIVQEIQCAIMLTQEYEKAFASVDSNGEVRNYLYPCESVFIEPYADMVVPVEDILHAAFHRTSERLGFQCILAIDLEPLSPQSNGFACLASSTGNIFRMSYKPQQRRLLSWNLVKAFDGHAPRMAAFSKYALLTGGIETPEHQRDWKSFASYIVKKMQPTCSVAQMHTLCQELDKEVPFTAELIPVRDVALTSDIKDRIRRERESQNVTVHLTFAVGSTKIQSDMFSIFKAILGNLTITEITFMHIIYIVLAKNNRHIDALLFTDLAAKIEQCRPEGCSITFDLRKTSQGIEVKFELNPTERLALTAWLSSIVMRSLTWQIEQNPLNGYTKLEVDYVEYVYLVKSRCHMRRFRKLLKQSYTNPIPDAQLRFMSVEAVKDFSWLLLCTMKLVRRARKSIRERRMKACINDLNSNLAKVEMRVFRSQNKKSEVKRKEQGLTNPVPIDIMKGQMNPELYEIECRLHEEAGLPKPLPYTGYSKATVGAYEQSHRVGFVSFAAIVTAVRKINRRA